MTKPPAESAYGFFRLSISANSSQSCSQAVAISSRLFRVSGFRSVRAISRHRAACLLQSSGLSRVGSDMAEPLSDAGCQSSVERHLGGIPGPNDGNKEQPTEAALH